MATEAELEKYMDIALARLGVAEELRWPLAGSVGLLIYIRFHSWLIAIAVFIAIYFLTTYWYDKAYKEATDAYERAHRALLDDVGRIDERLASIEETRQQLVEQAAKEGKTISAEAALKYVSELRAQYAAAGRDDDVRLLDDWLANFRDKHGSEIPIDEAYQLLRELERGELERQIWQK